MDETPTTPVEHDSPPARDVIDSDNRDELRGEILRCRDAVSGAAGREEVLEDRVVELEQQVEDLAAEIEKLSRITTNPAVRAVIAVTRPARRFVERRRTAS